MKHLEYPQNVKQIIYNLACDFGFEHYSTIDKIDYKFWEDIQSQDIAYALASRIAELESNLSSLKQKMKETHEELTEAYKAINSTNI